MRNSPMTAKAARTLRGALLLSTLALTTALAQEATDPPPTEGDFLYRVTLLRLTPGRYQELSAVLERVNRLARQAGDAEPFVIRHSQGDQWDFLLISPLGGHSEFHSAERTERRARAWSTAEGRAVTEELEELTAFQEDWFARSIEASALAARFEAMGLFHIEMFAGLPGKRAELLEQRRRENRYYRHLDRQLNVLFVRDSGPNWDAMTIGFYESLQAYAAAGARHSATEQDEAARVAGFEGVDRIGPYLRSLLSYHRDTLGVRP